MSFATRSRTTGSRNWLTVALGIAVASCSAGGSAPPENQARVTAAIEIVSGDAQTGFALEELPDAVVVRVTDSTGAPVSGQIINFKVTLGGGSVFAGAAISDQQGVARERWTLGPAAGLLPAPQEMEARAVDSKTGAPIVFATFTADAFDRPPTGLTYSSNPAAYTAGVPATPNTPAHGGGPVVAYSVSPPLPDGLELDPSTGIITGTATALADAEYTVTGANSGGSASVTLAITVTAPPPPTISAPPSSQTVRRGQSATLFVSASGTGILAYEWQKDGNAIPASSSPWYSTGPTTLADSGAEYRVIVRDSYGGTVTSSAAMLTVLSGFTATGSTGTTRWHHTSTLLEDGKVLVTGGWVGGNPMVRSTAELYDSSTGLFTATGSMTTGRADHTATRLADGTVLVVGGQDGGGTQVGRSAELYDPAAGTFTTTGTMATSRSSHTATALLDGRVLVTGGGSATAELYDPVSATFSATGSMAVARIYSTATLLADGKVLVTGGMNGSAKLSSAELYDPETGQFTAVGSMSTARATHTATLLASGKVLIAGTSGGSDPYAPYPVTAELYDPSSRTFSDTGSMSNGRRYGVAVRLPDGRVLITGGDGGPGAGILNTAEIYDPASAVFTTTGSMMTSRWIHSATVLSNNMVLVVGGDGPLVAELYE